MKKYIFLQLLTVILLLSTTALAATSSLSQIESYYKAGAYAKALQSATRATDAYSDPELHLLWGKSAEALGKKEEAMSAYERVLILDSFNSEARSRLETIYRDTGREDLLSSDAEDKPSEERAVKARLDISAGYDNNLNVSPGGAVLDDWGSVTGSPGKANSVYERMVGDIEYNYKWSSAPGWYTKGALASYYQRNNDARFYDMFLGSTAAGIGYKTDVYQLYFPVRFSYIHYHDMHMLNQYYFTPSYLRVLNSKNYIRLQGIYAKRDYRVGKYNDRDSTTLGIGAEHYHLYSDDLLLQFKLKYTTRDPDNGAGGRYVDADYLSFGASLKRNFTDKIYLKASYLYRKGEYRDNTGTVAVPTTIAREDKVHQGDIKVAYRYSDTVEFYAKEKHTYSNSNYVPADYTKKEITFGVTAKF